MKLNDTARSVINLFSTSLAMSFGHGMIIPTIPVMAAYFDVSIGLAAQVVTAHALGRFAGPLPTGIIVDPAGHPYRYDNRPGHRSHRGGDGGGCAGLPVDTAGDVPGRGPGTVCG